MKTRFLSYLLAAILALSCEKESDNPRVELLNGDWITNSTTTSSGGSLKFKCIRSTNYTAS